MVALIQESRVAMCDTCLLHRHLELIIVAGFGGLGGLRSNTARRPAMPPKMRPAGSLPAVDEASEGREDLVFMLP